MRMYRRLLRLAKPYWAHLAGIFALTMLGMPIALLAPIPLKIALDNVVGGQALPSWLAAMLPVARRFSTSPILALAAAMLVAVAILSSLQSLANWLLQTYTGEKLVLGFRAQLFRHVQRLSLTFHDTRGTADSIYRIQYDAASIQYITINGLIPLFTAFATLAGMIYITARIDRELALVALGVSPILFLLTRTVGERLRNRWKEVKKLDSSAMSVVQEVLTSVRVVKAFGREEHEQERFVRRSSERMWKQIHLASIQGGFDVAVAFVIAIGTAITLIIGVRHVLAGTLTLGGLVVVMAYLAQLYEPLKTLSKKVADLQSGVASAERAFSLLDESPDVIEKPHAKRLDRASGRFSFRDVCFSYDGKQPVLRDIGFEVAPGTRVGIQGTTGAGKTTLVGLLTRFYDPTHGGITLDGLDLREYRLADLRNQFAIVLQDTVLFSTSVAENIAYARPEATEREIINAARAANAHDFIAKLPQGYETRVGERGMRLSGGERQRISLARAFLKDAPILILDEPTSSVDVTTEAVIMQSMEALMKGRTSFLIAHRLSTLDNCDMRLHIENGALVEPAQKTSETYAG